MLRSATTLGVFTLLALAACADDALATHVVAPAEGSASGYFPIVIDVASVDLAADDVIAVSVGGVATYDLAVVDPDHVRVTVQGHAQPGDQPIVVATSAGAHTLASAFHYRAPAHPAFARMWAFGASLGQGVQAGTPTLHGSLVSPSAQVARAAGAYLPLPLFREGLIPQLGPDDIGPPPGCAIPDIGAFVIEAGQDILPKLTDPETGEIHLALGRVDPLIAAQNIAVGGARLRTMILGPASGDLGYLFVGKLVHEPDSELLAPMTRSQLEIVEDAQPTLIMSVDLFGNDIIVVGDALDLSGMTDRASLFADLAVVVERLAATGAEVFLPTLPPPSMLPKLQDSAGRLVAAATLTQVEVDERLAAMDAAAEAANAELVRLAAPHPTIHIVDLAAIARAAIAADGVGVGDVTLPIAKFGGVVGVDGVHFTDTGYAFVANAFIDAINDVLGTHIARIDLAAVFASDRGSPSGLRAAGFDIDACE